MQRADYGIIFTPGRPPEEEGYPGFGYRTSTENGLYIERDVAVQMRDGAHIYIDIYRPADRQDTSLPAIISWGPYGKHVTKRIYPNSGVREEWISSYTPFEGPDPLYWCRHGYAIVVADPRGMWYSQGNYFHGDFVHEAPDLYDLIEWVARQPWSNGKVGMSGVSYLARCQWLVAALKPPHLAAINPWEGFVDMYREMAYHGGIRETNFISTAAKKTNLSLGLTEDIEQSAIAHPFYDAYWERKMPPLEKIEVPAFVVASWSDHGLHSRGTLEGFKRIASKEKWLEVHGRKKWEYYYQPENVEKLRQFFDYFLKGINNDWPKKPRVWLEVRERYYEGSFRAEQEWPLARTKYRKLYLNAATGQLQLTPPEQAARVRYEATQGAARFDYQFDQDTELTGYMKLKLWVEADGADDMDLFVAVQKFDREGNYVPFAYYALYEDGPVALGWLRVSHRELDEERSTPYQPVHLHQKELRLKPGERVPVEIEIWPSSTFFAKGERLRLVIQGKDIYTYDPKQGPMMLHEETRNQGEHIIHAGGSYDSYLLIPQID